MPPVTTPPAPIDLAVMSVDPRRPWSNNISGANIGWACAFQVRRPTTVSQVGFHVQTQSGNIDIGIYKGTLAALTLLSSCGSFACPAAGVATQALSGSVTLIPGVMYYAAYSADNGTARLYLADALVSTGLPTSLGLFGFKTTAFPLPSSGAFSNPGSYRVPFLVFS